MVQKEKFELEYPLKVTSMYVLWNAVGTPYGLSEWFAEDVNVVGDKYVFMWNQYEQAATLIGQKQNEYLRLQWEDDSDTDYFFEMKILKHELTGDLSLQVTDFAEPEDKDDEILLWDRHIDDLKRKLGI